MELIYWLVRSFIRREGYGVSTIVILVSCEHHFIRTPENLVQHPSSNMYRLLFRYTQRTPGYLPPATPFEQPTPTPDIAPVPGIKSTFEPTAPSSIPPTPMTTAPTTPTPVTTEITTAYAPIVTTPRTTPMFTTPRTAEATPDISGVVVVKLPETETKPSNDNTDDNVDISSSVVVKIPDGLSTATENPPIPNSPKTIVDTDIASVVEINIPDVDIDQYPAGRADNPTADEPVNIDGRDIDYSYVDNFNIPDEILSS